MDNFLKTLFAPRRQEGSALKMSSVPEKKPLRPEEAALYELARKDAWLMYGRPFISTQADLKSSMPKFATEFRGEFCIATCYDPDFVAELMYNGFLTMADAAGSVEVITPKLHTSRCLVMFDDLPAPHKSTMRKAKAFEFSANTAFAEVCKGINKQHGPSWFYPKLVRLFTEMNSRPEGCYGGKVHVHSFEIWHNGVLVAGEAGYSCGSVYTSLSGFSGESSAGTIQMYAMASHLKQLGFTLWDLGMGLRYKMEEFEAKNYPRLEFLEKLREHRDEIIEGSVTLAERKNAKDFLALLRKSQANNASGAEKMEEGE